MDAVNLQPWTFVAGLGLFLFGMSQLEQGLDGLIGAPMRKLLRYGTRTPARGIVTGALTTAVLQSSSVVMLLVLAFVGAGILDLRNALGIVLGANLGTTFTGWVVATLGFKLDLEALALPMLGLGAMGVVFLRTGARLSDAGRALLGLGLLLLGLIYMKESIASLRDASDITALADYPLFVYLLAGFLFTAIIQSSSATMMITLSALSLGLVELQTAAALVVGADLGTTITALLGGMRGRAEKKRVALAHFLFNLITDMTAFLLLVPLLHLLRFGLGITDPLFLLVAFHSSFNLLGILLFAPFLGPFARYLERRFTHELPRAAQFVSHVPPDVTDAALDALRLEATNLIGQVMRYNLRQLGAHGSEWPPVTPSPTQGRFPRLGGDHDEYARIKLLEGEILDFTLALQRQPLTADDAQQVSCEIVAIRHALQAAKAVKDVCHDLQSYRRAGGHRELLVDTLAHGSEADYAQMSRLWRASDPSTTFTTLAELDAANRASYEARTRAIYEDLTADRYAPEDVSSALNISREAYGSTKALIESVSHHLLAPAQVSDLEAVPPS